MHKYFLVLACALLLAIGSRYATAGNEVLHLDIKDVIDSNYSAGKLDGSVKFYLAGQSTPKVLQTYGQALTNKKTNGVGKSDAEGCKWVMLTALIALQNEAKQRGANAVIGITSYFKRAEYKSATQYECHAGNIMSGVALKGTYAKISTK